MKTPQEVDALKSNWLGDPCWDIEDTDGFEEYYTELKAFRLEQEKKWDTQHKQRIKNKAVELGDPSNLKLAQYVLTLEERLAKIEELINK